MPHPDIERAKKLWVKTKESLQSAELLYNNEHYNNSVSRSYYTIYQAMASILLSDSGEIKELSKHGTVISKFLNKYSNRSKVFSSYSKIIDNAKTTREIADYRDILIDKKKAKKQLDNAKKFINFILKVFKNKEEVFK